MKSDALTYAWILSYFRGNQYRLGRKHLCMDLMLLSLMVGQLRISCVGKKLVIRSTHFGNLCNVEITKLDAKFKTAKITKNMQRIHCN